MKDIKNMITSLNIGALYIAYDTYFKSIIKERNDRMVQSNRFNQLENLKRAASDLESQSAKIEIPQNKPLGKEVSDRLEYLDSTLKNSQDLILKSKNNFESAVSEPVITGNPKIQEAFRYMDEAEKALKSGQDQMTSLQELIAKFRGSGSNNFSDNIIQLLLEFQELISSFSLIQKLTIINMLTGALVLNSLFSIIVIFYGESLINYFLLETKFPKLAKFIKYRNKLQQYYFLVNIIIIIVAIVIMIYANYLMFINFN